MAGGAKRIRNSFFFYVSCVNGTYSLRVGYKPTKGPVQPLSATKKCMPTKVPFGPVRSCELRKKCGVSGAEEEITEYKFVNARHEAVALPDNILNNLEFEVNSFSRSVTELYVEKKKKLLAVYVSLINNSENFVHHSVDLHTADGLNLLEVEKGEESIGAAGGSLDHFRQFVIVAKENAMVVESGEKALDEIVTRRKLAGTGGKRAAVAPPQPENPKLSRVEIIENKEKEALEDEGGLEAEYRGSYVGVAQIPLENISISKEMDVKVMPFRVNFIMSSMRKRY